MAFERLNIPKIYHPFICGPDNEKAKEIANITGARINIPPASVEKDEMTVAGEKESVQKAVKMIMEIYKEKEKRTKTVSVEVINFIKIIYYTVVMILHETNVSTFLIHLSFFKLNLRLKKLNTNMSTDQEVLEFKTFCERQVFLSKCHHQLKAMKPSPYVENLKSLELL